MKVLFVNGSPEKNGCTFTAFEEMIKIFDKEDIESEIMWLGNTPINDCINCGGCGRNKNNRCVFDNDIVNRFLEKAEECDGIVLGSPVYYGHADGRILSVLDRAFFAGSRVFKLKPCAVVASARRAGTTCAIDDLMKYPTISQMYVVGSSYWNMVHGFTPEDVKKDLEGLQTMRVLARNMAYLMKCLEAANDVPQPESERKIFTNFID